MPLLGFLLLVFGLPVAGFAVSREAGLVAATVALVAGLVALSGVTRSPAERRRRR